jgi:hypothetical protein
MQRKKKHVQYVSNETEPPTYVTFESVPFKIASQREKVRPSYRIHKCDKTAIYISGFAPQYCTFRRRASPIRHCALLGINVIMHRKYTVLNPTANVHYFTRSYPVIPKQ